MPADASGVSSAIPSVSRWEVSKVAITAVLGTAVENFDFTAIGIIAAIAWPVVFWPQSSYIVALLLSFAVYGIGFAGRTIGALVFGHIGDRLGRRVMMMWTLLFSGVATLGIGLTPGYNSIGIMGGVIITIFRFVQGVGFGGELPGAAVWVNELTQDRPKWRGLWNCFTGGIATNLGSITGSNLTSWLVVAMGTLFLSSAFNAGWRIVFYLGALMLVIAFYLRLKTTESPVFLDLVAKHHVKRVPSAYLLRHHWKTVIKLIAVGLTAGSFYIVAAFTAGFLTARGMSAALASSAVSTSLLVTAIYPILIAGILTRWVKPLYLAAVSSLGMIVFIFPFFYLLQTGVWLYAVLGTSIFIVIIDFSSATWPSIFPDYISTEARTSGVGLGFQMGVMLSGGFLPFIAAGLISMTGGTATAWPYISLVILAYNLVALIGLISLSRSKKFVDVP